MQIISVITSIAAVTMYYFVLQKKRWALLGWACTNIMFWALAIIRKDYGQIILWSVYSIMTIKGYADWRNHD